MCALLPPNVHVYFRTWSLVLHTHTHTHTHSVCFLPSQGRLTVRVCYAPPPRFTATCMLKVCLCSCPFVLAEPLPTSETLLADVIAWEHGYQEPEGQSAWVGGEGGGGVSQQFEVSPTPVLPACV